MLKMLETVQNGEQSDDEYNNCEYSHDDNFDDTLGDIRFKAHVEAVCQGLQYYSIKVCMCMCQQVSKSQSIEVLKY